MNKLEKIKLERKIKKETKEYISKMKEMFGEYNVKQIYLAKYGTRHIGKIENILEE